MPMADRPVRVRIAPSPTGDPHVGTAYIALFNYVFAKQQGGKFVLRVEDTDQTRFRADSEQQIYDALHWLGLSWDEGPDIGGPFGPYRQSERSAIYKEYAQILVDKGAAYRCFCSEDRLAKLKIQAKAEKKTFGYDRLCRGIAPAEALARAQTEPFVIRLAMPLAGPIEFKDQLRDELITRDAHDLDDQVLMKSDGLPTYHLANVVDDHLMEITHVVRAEEWISSTPKHIVLYKAFGWEPPLMFHMPLLRNADKTKVSKRKQPTSINYYKDIGILPETMLNFLATMGWSFGDGKTEVFSLAEMITAFSWDKISLGGPVFNLEKLTWMNEQYLHAMSIEQLADRVIAWRMNKAFLVKVLPLVQKRTKKLDELVPQLEYFFAGDLDYAPVLAEMKIDGVAPADLAKAVLAFVEKFEARDGFTVAILSEEAHAWADANKWTTKQAFPLLRLAATARKASPPIFETLEVLGKEIVRRRLRRAAEVINSGGKVTR